MKYQFFLENNPFYILKATATDDLDVLSEKQEDALFDAKFKEQDIGEAYRALTASLPRLRAEVSWLLGVGPEEIKVLLECVAEQNINFITAFGSEFSAQIKVNLIASCLAQAPEAVSEELLGIWLSEWEDFSSSSLLTLINEQRQISGFPKVSLEQLDAALTEVRAAQANILIYDLESYGLNLSWLLEELRKKEESGNTLLSSSLLVELVNAAERASAPEVERVKESLLSRLDAWGGVDNTQKKAETELIIKLMERLHNLQELIIKARILRGEKRVNITEVMFVNSFIEKIYADSSKSEEITGEQGEKVHAHHALLLFKGINQYLCYSDESKNALLSHISSLELEAAPDFFPEVEEVRQKLVNVESRNKGSSTFFNIIRGLIMLIAGLIVIDFVTSYMSIS